MSPDTDTLAKSVRLAAMNLLARREHSFRELARKLALRFPEEIVLEQLSRLREEKLQSDERFVESFVYSRQQKGYGPVRIRSELYQKGVSSELMEEYLIEGDECWEQIAAEIRCKKFGDAVPDDYKLRAKQQRYLMQRGFNAGQINTCLRL